MSSADPSIRTRRHWAKHRLRQFWLIIPLVVILAALMMSDLGDFHGLLSALCSRPLRAHRRRAKAASPPSSICRIAKWALRYTPSPSVAIIYIDPAHDPPDLITNVCASRAFLARLIADLNALSAHVIVIDKYYSAAACAEQDKNAAFINAMESSKIPHRRWPCRPSFLRRQRRVRLPRAHPAAPVQHRIQSPLRDHPAGQRRPENPATLAHL